MSDPVILAEQVSFSYPPLTPGGNAVPLLRALDLSVVPGGSIAIMGPNGVGKSTLCYLLMGLIPQHTGGNLTGYLQVAGQNVTQRPPAIGSIGLLFQDAATQLFNATVADEVAWGLESMGVLPKEIGPRVAAALRSFGLSGMEDRHPWALSGGEQKRLALAAIWAMRPQVLLLDEPLGGLDPKGQMDVLSALRDLREEGHTLLLTTLRPPVAELAGEVSLLQEMHLTAPVPATQILAEESLLVDAGILYPTANWPVLAPPVQPSDREGHAVVVQDLHFNYPGGKEILQGLNLSIPHGQLVALIGPNGAGKTTLVRHLNGLLHPVTGTVAVMGHDVARCSVGQLAQEVGFLFQRPEQQLFSTTVRDEIAYGPRQLKLPGVDRRVEQALERFGLVEIAGTPPAILSYGVQRTVTLASLTVLDTPVLVLDEPTVGLDGFGWRQFLLWLAERRAAGVTIIMVTHELSLAALADRVVLLEQGQIVGDGRPDAVLPVFMARDNAGG